MNSVPNDGKLDSSKFKAFADGNLDMAIVIRYFFDKVENIVGKGENAGYQHFLLFQKCFQEFSSLGSLEVAIL